MSGSSAIRFACPACGGSMKAPAGQEGDSVQCPRCQATVTVPGGKASPSAPPRPSPAPPAPAKPSSERPQSVSASKPRESTPPKSAARSSAESARDDDQREQRPAAPREPEFTVRCPVCRTGIAATPSQIGQSVACPDCLTEVLIRPPQESRKKTPPATAAPRGDTTAGDDDVSLSQPVATPRYRPSKADGVSDDELYGDATPAGPASASSSTAKPTEEFSVVCPLCSSRMMVLPVMIGKEVKCNDCHTRFEVKPPPRKHAPSAPVADDESEFKISDTFERPKYQPMTRGKVTREVLDDMESREAARADDAAPTSSSQAAASSASFDFFVNCKVCGSRVAARHDQIGSLIPCGDCFSEVLVLPPKEKPRGPKLAADDEPPAFRPPPAPPPPPPRAATGAAPSRPATGTPVPSTSVTDENAQRMMTQAEREFAEQAARDRASSNYRRSFWAKWFGILRDTGVLARGVLLTVLMFAVLTLISQMAYYAAEQGPEMLFGILVILFLALFTALLTFTLCKFCIVIVESAADGNAGVEDWSDDMFMDFIGQTIYMVVAVLAAGLPGAVLTMLSSIVMPGEAWALIWMVASIWVCFPVVLMSSLEASHPLNIVSIPVMRTIGLMPRFWLRFYAQTLVLALAAAALLILIPWWLSVVHRVVVAPGLLILIVLYFRALGLIAADVNVAMNRQAEEAEPESAESDA